MPLIEELVNAPKSSAPGFAYVPDTGYDPSKEAIVPTGARKRQSRNVSSYGGENLSRQEQQKISRRLAELERDNRADVHIALPGKPTNVAQRGLRGQMTPAVKKIMQSAKAISNHLADEEALIDKAGGSIEPPPLPDLQNDHSSSRSAAASKTSHAGRQARQKDTTSDAIMTDAADHQEPPDEAFIYEAPAPPTKDELEALVTAPALPYAAARVLSTNSTLPARQFCVICGYWGRARCKKCGERVCGLECLAGHQDSCQRY